MENFAPTPRTSLRRYPNRGSFDKTQIYAILDEGFFCHVGFAVDGQPYVIPTGYARSDDQIYFHGSAVSRMLREAGNGADLCITVTLIDALVLARSGFHHSMNYRSVLVLGKARLVAEREEKLAALRAFTNHIVANRWDEIRPPTEQELIATSVLSLPLNEASAKIRSGPPIDDAGDYALPIWAGIVPLRSEIGEPVPDPKLSGNTPPPDPRRLRRP